ncbi:hypothetical protein SEA_ANNADREAMY_185 [Streptomyces phage Annadreamy]|uniref:KTSC domain-containing protein n=2 Tax=Annadreamyvirus annadreamy TaxID=2846392 RepID=A0A345GTJ8_9CAUD|nr:hypothetical protein HWB75_gp093 [Streptomyces phage Annadreamy]AXG66270.1 hypothetical protein SEA_ANNADREAMY_185 [Streptomyces phage Annadreamy]QGH79493.1 hypothetical protein SEA_LIMPID_192 [Streptomyces phage Limpid]
MKTAVYEYTHRTNVDSSLADVVYYNATNYTMAIQFKNNGYSTPSVFYGSVPEVFYDRLVKADSLGKTYNMFVKDKLPNLSGGTVYDVTYTLAGEADSEPIVDQKVATPETMRYRVKGYVRHVGTFEADSLEEAREFFLDSLVEDGYDASDLAVTEVYIVE